MSESAAPAVQPEQVPDVLAPPPPGAVDSSQKRTFWNRWRCPPDPALVKQIDLELYFEGPLRESGLNRFFTLLTLAAMIAAFGLYTDSVLVVVAAMLINPMMTSIMGLTLALVSGRIDRQLASLVLIAAATGLSIGVGWLAGELLPRSGTIPVEVISRSHPKLIDLVIAIVSGLAGAYALVRKDANAALPGVAVAISLVTPLVATGMLIAYGDGDLASGTFQLFLLNLAAIVFSGAIVFVNAGFLPIYHLRSLPRRIKLGLLTAAFGILIVAIPLAPASKTVVTDAIEQDEIATIIDEWVAEQGAVESMGYTLTSDRLTVDLTGPAIPANAFELRTRLRSAVSTETLIDVRFFEYTPLIRERGTDKP
jgi:uncharacterized hydrophobic protein (TIGR00271 family)